MIQVAVIDDHEAIRLGVAAALASHGAGRISVVSQDHSVQAFLDRQVHADVVLLDLQLSDGTDPLELLPEMVGKLRAGERWNQPLGVDAV